MKERLRIALADQKFEDTPSTKQARHRSPPRVRDAAHPAQYELPRRPPLEHHHHVPSTNPGFPSTKPPEIITKHQDSQVNDLNTSVEVNGKVVIIPYLYRRN